MLRRTG